MDIRGGFKYQYNPPHNVTCGDSVTHAIKDSDGALYGWGKNYYGMVGNGAGATAGSVSSPVAAIFASDDSAVTSITQISGNFAEI